MYAYPGYVTDALIDLMSGSPQIVPYLDMPLQHASPQILRAMKRPANMEWVRETIAKMRVRIPGLALRTTLISGFPGETEEDHQCLLDFIREIEFDHLGVFPFSFESGTTSAPLGDPIPPELKQQRVEEIMAVQESISLKKMQRLIGKTLQVLVEGYGDGISIARSYRDAPEIDGLVIIEDQLTIGNFQPVQVTGALAHDLIAKAIKP